YLFFFFQAEDGIRDFHVTGVQTCALPISSVRAASAAAGGGRYPCYPDVARTTGTAAPGPRHAAGAVRLPSPGAAGHPRPAGADSATSTGLPSSLRNCPAARAGPAPDGVCRPL